MRVGLRRPSDTMRTSDHPHEPQSSVPQQASAFDQLPELRTVLDGIGDRPLERPPEVIPLESPPTPRLVSRKLQGCNDSPAIATEPEPEGDSSCDSKNTSAGRAPAPHPRLEYIRNTTRYGLRMRGTPPQPVEYGHLGPAWLPRRHPFALRAIVRKMPVKFWECRNSKTRNRHFCWETCGKRIPHSVESLNRLSSIVRTNRVVGSGRNQNLWRSRKRHGDLILAREGVRAASRQFRKWDRLGKASPKHLPPLLQGDRFFSLLTVDRPYEYTSAKGFWKISNPEKGGTWLLGNFGTHPTSYSSKWVASCPTARASW